MGKPFEKEVAELGDTYSWACNADVSKISDKLCSTWDLPLLTVGSGGSYSAAEFQANLHQSFFHSIAQAVTPMELIRAIPRNRRASVWLMSASGGNVDIRRAFQHSALLEIQSVSALVGRQNSALKELSERYQYSDVFEFILPSGRDGFLATNSLFGFSTLMYRAYCHAVKRPEVLPNNLNELIAKRVQKFSSLEQILCKTEALWLQDTLHIIYSPDLKSTAVDIESKFIEAGLGGVHIADLRNFAHGRHHWFSKNIENNGVLALTTPQDAELCSKTLNWLPDSIPKSHITIDNTANDAGLVGLLLSFHFTLTRGKIRGIDPGRPKVPSYGSKIYRLTTKSGFIRSLTKKKAAVARKNLDSPTHSSVDIYWDKEYRKFTLELSKRKFGGVVLDYDGTVVDRRMRGKPPTALICLELIRLMDQGVMIGFATGRGKSIRHELQSSNAIPSKYWDNILIGYYNGYDISNLSDNLSPDCISPSSKELDDLVERLRESPFVALTEHEITSRKSQITVEPKTTFPETLLWEISKDLLSCQPSQGINVVRSSHSIDILAKHVTKLAVVKTIREKMREDLDVLAIGDRGRWPGNDSILLSEPFSLSVDEVSFSNDRCWNLCSAGVKGPQGTLGYLKRLTVQDGFALFK